MVYGKCHVEIQIFSVYSNSNIHASGALKSRITIIENSFLAPPSFACTPRQSIRQRWRRQRTAHLRRDLRSFRAPFAGPDLLMHLRSFLALLRLPTRRRLWRSVCRVLPALALLRGGRVCQCSRCNGGLGWLFELRCLRGCNARRWLWGRRGEAALFFPRRKHLAKLIAPRIDDLCPTQLYEPILHLHTSLLRFTSLVPVHLLLPSFQLPRQPRFG